MITARLNRLLAAYQQARRLVGNANRGKAIPGVALRWCARIRQAIKAEILVVEAVIRPERLFQLRPQIIPGNIPANERELKRVSTCY
ncbi:hypothetical protein Q673_02815 [Marinobacter sp. EN3]|uniref:hypothetical protein n=1 Tax=Marinobacter sp. EN3 TaxID=1397533 RepID=UPI0003B843F7|nr:hypothetical protein [Marinobacter sp. EN3]ERS12560.1 hypothetical protein Q673_02815 [Marinobacter sp. EN3]